MALKQLAHIHVENLMWNMDTISAKALGEMINRWIKTSKHAKTYEVRDTDNDLLFDSRYVTIQNRTHLAYAIKLEVFIRDDFTCQYCGDKGKFLECDHVIPWSKGGTHDKSNLATSCKSCNRKKGTKLLSEWVQA